MMALLLILIAAAAVVPFALIGAGRHVGARRHTIPAEALTPALTPTRVRAVHASYVGAMDEVLAFGDNNLDPLVREAIDVMSNFDPDFIHVLRTEEHLNVLTDLIDAASEGHVSARDQVETALRYLRGVNSAATS